MIENAIPCLFAVVALSGMSIFVALARPGNAAPLVIHNTLWALVLAFIASDLVAYNSLSLRAWLTILLGLGAFNLGYLMLEIRGDRHPARRVESSSPLVSGRSLIALLAAYLLGLTVYLVVIGRQYGPLAVITDPAAIRGNQQVPYLTTVPFWARLLLFLGPFLFAILVTKSGTTPRLSTATRAVLATTVGASMLLLLQRTNLFIAILWVISLIVFGLRSPDEERELSDSERAASRVRRRRQYMGIALAAIVALGSFQVVAHALGKTGSQAVSTGAIHPVIQKSGLTSPVTYLTSGVIAFGQLVDSDDHTWPAASQPGIMRVGLNNPQTWGGASLEPFMKLVPIVQPWSAIAPFTEVPFLTNVYTWYESFYRDFRAAGVAVGMFLVGGVLSATYQLRKQSKAAHWAGALLLSVVFLSTFVARFNSTIHLLGAVLAISFGLYADRRTKCSTSLPPTASTAAAHESESSTGSSTSS